MPCYSPIQAYRAKVPDSQSGVRRLAFGRSPNSSFSSVPTLVACGKCIGCTLERSRQWAVRCVHEASLSERNAFITLTYDDAHLPAFGSLDPKHFTDFMKRVRRPLAARSVRYFMCGEYGGRYGRPHYHALLFGLDFADKVFFRTTESKESIFTSKTLDQLWGMGFASTGAVTFASAAYVARYVTKKLCSHELEVSLDRDTGEVSRRLPEFVRMSLKPGLGAGWLHKYLDDVYPSDEVIMNRRPQRPPRYYDKLLGVGDAPELERIKLERVKRADLHFEDQSPRRLRDAEVVKRAQIRSLKRNLGE